MFCRKAEGYPSGNYTLENKLLASKYVAADNHWQLLANCTEVRLGHLLLLLCLIIIDMENLGELERAHTIHPPCYVEIGSVVTAE